MKQIRNFSIITIVLVILITFIHYSGLFNNKIDFVLVYTPLILAFLGIILFYFSFILNAKILKLKEEISFQSKNIDYTTEESNITISKEEVKAENVINYDHLIESIYSRIQKGSQKEYFESLLSSIAKELNGVQAIAFLSNKKDELLHLTGKYAYYSEDEIKPIKIGQGVSGQVAKDQKMLVMNNVPEGYIQVLSGLGSSTPNHLVIYPIIQENKTIALLELASFEDFMKNIDLVFEKLSKKIIPDIKKYIS